MELDVEFQMPNGPLDRRRLQTRAGVSPTIAGSSQEIPGAARWEPGLGDGSDASWDTTAPFPIDENHILGQSSSDFSSRSIVPASDCTSLSSGHTKPSSRLGQSDASNLSVYTISPTPWLDDQLRRQPELEAPEEGWLRPLHIAAQKGNLRILKILARHSPNINDSDSHGQTPLIHAAQGGYSEAVSILLANGAHLDSVDRERRSALHWAVLHRRRDVLEILLERYAQDKEAYGPFINAYDDAGWTPLHMAIYWEFEAGVVLLIQYGADVTTKAAHCPYAEVRQKVTQEASSLSSST
ncbi:Ankyrin repeat-containing protein [Apiospora kogelbergensis]|uniref:Ankyrin repeat-containing protein n=1 Tax=Apiospora kogelbergensis TaxID=1337665 RepID=A0AAW0R7D0_9PEZI